MEPVTLGKRVGPLMSGSFIEKCLESGLHIRDHSFENYLRDESRFTGHAEALITAYFESDITKAILLCNETHTPLTVVSGKTSLTGAPVPLGGTVLDVKKLNSINSDDPYKVGPGAILRDYKNLVDSIGLFYPPDPTSEDSCTIGGNVACNASGALSYLYGPTRDYIQGLRIVLPTGVILNLQRGDVFSNKGAFRIPKGILEPHPENELLIPAPSWETPPWAILKNTAGFYAADHMDLIDLFIGSEGILGVIIGITTKLLKKRRPFFSMIIYLTDREITVGFVEALNLLTHLNSPFSKATPDINLNKIPHVQSFNEVDYSRFRLIVPSCMEWFGFSTASLLPDESRKHLMESYGAVFVEQEYDNPEQMIESTSQWSELIDQFNLICGDKSGRIRTQVALDSQQSRAFRNLRQSVPEKLNERIHPGFIKIGSDFSVPTDKLEDLLKMYDERLPLGHSYVFGHIGNSHLHANILPGTQAELEVAQQVMLEMSKQVVSLGGSIAGEHGIGKIKSKYLEMAVGKDAVRQMKHIKKCLDPNNILNRHTLLSIEN
ncbi:MAG: FAD-binding oxidoreductase [Desulfomonilaceae bacterium]